MSSTRIRTMFGGLVKAGGAQRKSQIEREIRSFIL
jgi:hypothetical protein